MTRAAALYARPSVEEGEKFGLASQVTELRALAAANRSEIMAEYLDDGLLLR
jgi:DNA invertase Pin-like site-specific DNA recombinase